MASASLELQAREKVRIAARMLAEARQLYEESGHAYDRPSLNAEVLGRMVEELTQRLAEAGLLTPLS